MEAYANKHGYGLTWATPSQSVQESKMMKYALASEMLGPDNLVVIADCDVFVTNDNVRVEDVWRDWSHDATEVLISRDAHWQMGVPVNSGLIILRGGDYSRRILQDMLEKGRVTDSRWKGRFNADTLVDQPRLTVSLLETDELEDPPMTEVREKERRERGMYSPSQPPPPFPAPTVRSAPESDSGRSEGDERLLPKPRLVLVWIPL